MPETHTFAQPVAAPVFTLDCELVGPDTSDREEYLFLFAQACLAEQERNFVRAQALRVEARKLLNSQWREVVHNTVTIGGKSDVINQYFKGSSYTAAWYMGLAGSGTISTSDTMASHSGWAELVPYSGTRPAITWGTTSSGSNTASQVSFTITSAATIAGAFITNNSTAGGTSGTLYSAADFGSVRSVAGGDTLNITPTVTFS